MEKLEILHELGFKDAFYSGACNEAIQICDEVDFCDFASIESLEEAKAGAAIIGDDDYRHLVLILSGILHSYGKYLERGIGDDIYFDTMSDAFVWAELYRRLEGRVGLKETGWLLFHIRLELFRLGRLQFQLDDTPLQFRSVLDGKKVIQVHIPDIGPLYADECMESFRKAKSFYPEMLPFICDSWLLEPELEKVLSPSSNILSFQKLFHIFHVDRTNPQCHQRVFEFSMRRDTRLQRNILSSEAEGTVFGVGYGYILPEEIV